MGDSKKSLTNIEIEVLEHVMGSCAMMVQPPVFGCLYLIVFLILSLVFLIVSFFIGGKLLLISETTLMLAVLVSIPKGVSILADYYALNSLAKGAVMSFFGVIAVATYSVVVLGLKSLGMWIGLLLILLLLLFIGASIFDARLKNIRKRLNSLAENYLAARELEKLHNTSKRENLFYASIPLGLAIGLTYGLLMNFDKPYILILEALATLGVAILLLLVLLTSSALTMSDSLILFEKADTDLIILEREKTSFLGSLATMLRLHTTPKSNEKDFKHSLDMAYLTSDLRRIYFYDSVHSCMLLIGFSLTMISIGNITFASSNYVSIALVSLFLLFIFCYLPFSIGQYHLHENILDNNKLEGIARRDLKTKLNETSPLYPQSDFLSALVSTGTSGGLIAALAYEALKNALK